MKKTIYWKINTGGLMQTSANVKVTNGIKISRSTFYRLKKESKNLIKRLHSAA